MRRRGGRVGAQVGSLLLCAWVGIAFAQPAVAPKPAPEEGTSAVERVGPQPEKRGLDTRVTVHIREMELPQAVRLLAEEAGINIAIGKDVSGKVTCNLSDVTARTALEALLRSNGYESGQVGGVLIVVKPEPQRPAAPGPAPSGGPLKMVRKTFSLPYTGMERDSRVVGIVGSTGGYQQAAVQPTGRPLNEIIHGMLSPAGKMAYYERQHIIIVEDDEATVQAVEEFVKVLWAVPVQVYIDSALLEISLDDAEKMGLNWDLSSKNIRATRVNPLSGVVHSSDSVGASNLPSLFGGTDKFFSYGISTSNISVFLEALATRKRVDLRSRPRVLVMNHRTATIIVGQEIPYLSSQQATGGGVGPISTYEFKEVAVRLEVTPHVSDDKMVFMDIHPTVKSLIEYLPANNEPVLSTREAASNVAVRDGATVVIGGLVQRNITRTWNETPYIARIPLIGWLFRQKTSDDTKNELIFLLSPSILTPEMMQEMMNSSANMLAEPRPHAGESPASKPKW